MTKVRNSCSLPQFVLVLFWFAVQGCRREPATYEDYVLQALEGTGKSDAVAAVIVQACRGKFPQDQGLSGVVDLTRTEVAALDGRGGPSYGNTFSGTLYNGNTHVQVTEVTFAIRTIEDSREVVRRYRVALQLAPQTSKDDSFTLVPGDRGEEFKWSIASAKGRRQQVQNRWRQLPERPTTDENGKNPRAGRPRMKRRLANGRTVVALRGTETLSTTLRCFS